VIESGRPAIRRTAPWLSPALAGGLFVLAVAAPHALGHRRGSGFWSFTGIVRLAEDNNAYQAWAKQSQEGFNRFLVAYNPAPQPRLVIHPWFWAVGRASRWTGLSLPLVMNGFHILGALLFAVALWAWLGTLSFSRVERLTAYGLALFAGGAGPWLGHLAAAGGFWARAVSVVTGPEGALTADLGFFDYVLFSNVLHFPLSGISLALMFFALTLLSRPTPARGALAGAATGLLFLVHPYDGVLTWMLAAVILFLHGRRAAAAGAVFYAAGAPALLYLLWTVPGQPSLEDFTRHLREVPLSPLSLFWASFFLLPPAAWEAWRAIREKRRERGLLMAWVVMAAFLGLMPLDFRIKFVHGAFAALAALAAPALAGGAVFLARGGRRWLLLALASAGVWAVSAGNLRLWREDMDNVRRPLLPYHIPVLLADTLRRLDAAASPDEVVLAPRRLGMFVPAWAGCRVYVGHWSQSPDALRREREVDFFLSSGRSDAQRRAFLQVQGIDYLLLSPPYLGPEADRWDGSPFLKKIHSNEGYRLYRVDL
jgi:hypothetical protein